MAGETVLVIEDEEDIAELIRYNLAEQSYNVCPASSCASTGWTRPAAGPAA